MVLLYICFDKLTLSNKQNENNDNELIKCPVCDNITEEKVLDKYGISFYGYNEKFNSLIGKYIYYEDDGEEESFFEINNGGSFKFHFQSGDGSFYDGDDKDYKLMIQTLSDDTVYLFFINFDNKYLSYSFIGYKTIGEKYMFSTLMTTPISGAEEYLWKNS